MTWSPSSTSTTGAMPRSGRGWSKWRYSGAPKRSFDIGGYFFLPGGDAGGAPRPCTAKGEGAAAGFGFFCFGFLGFPVAFRHGSPPSGRGAARAKTGRPRTGLHVADHALARDDFSLNRHPAVSVCLSMMFAENREPLFGIMP